MSVEQAPDHLVSEDMVDRHLALTQPTFAVIPEFQSATNEIETALCTRPVLLDRRLRMRGDRAHVESSPHRTAPSLPQDKGVVGKGASNSWDPSIDALLKWGYSHEPFAAQPSRLYEEVRNAGRSYRPFSRRRRTVLKWWNGSRTWWTACAPPSRRGNRA